MDLEPAFIDSHPPTAALADAVATWLDSRLASMHAICHGDSDAFHAALDTVKEWKPRHFEEAADECCQANGALLYSLLDTVIKQYTHRMRDVATLGTPSPEVNKLGALLQYALMHAASTDLVRSGSYCSDKSSAGYTARFLANRGSLRRALLMLCTPRAIDRPRAGPKRRRYRPPRSVAASDATADASASGAPASGSVPPSSADSVAPSDSVSQVGRPA